MAKIPTILEAGRADGKLVTSDAIFDENKEMFQSEINDIQDTLNSDNPNKPLSANQGKVLKDLLDSKVIEAGSVPIDTEPIEGNITHLVNSDGLAKKFNKHNIEIILGGIYDVSAHNNGEVFESLSALLSSSNLDTLIPTSVRHGGMSIRFKQSSDNKYVQFRCMYQNFTTNVNQWQGVTSKVKVYSRDLIESRGVSEILFAPNEFSIQNGSQGNPTNAWVVTLKGKDSLAIPVTPGHEYRLNINKQPETGFNFYWRIYTYSTINPSNLNSDIKRNEVDNWDNYYTNGQSIKILDGELGLSIQLTELTEAGASQADDTCVPLRSSNFIQGDLELLDLTTGLVYTVYNLQQDISDVREDIAVKSDESLVGAYEKSFEVAAGEGHSSNLDRVPVNIKAGTKFGVFISASSIRTEGYVYVTYKESGSGVFVGGTNTVITAQNDISSIGLNLPSLSSGGAGTVTFYIYVSEALTTYLNNKDFPELYRKNYKFLNTSFIGKDSTFVSTFVHGLTPNRKYRVILKNSNYDRSHITGVGFYIFVIDSYYNEVATFIGGTDAGKTIPDYYDITIPSNSDYIKIGGRANLGVEVEFYIIDITEISENISAVEYATLDIESLKQDVKLIPGPKFNIQNGSQGNPTNTWVVTLCGTDTLAISVIPGHKYRLDINKEPEDGYNFYYRIVTYSTDSPSTLLSNTEREEVGNWNKYYELSDVFDIRQNENGLSIQLTELTEPGAGQVEGSCIPLRTTSFKDSDITLTDVTDSTQVKINKLEKFVNIKESVINSYSETSSFMGQYDFKKGYTYIIVIASGNTTSNTAYICKRFGILDTSQQFTFGVPFVANDDYFYGQCPGTLTRPFTWKILEYPDVNIFAEDLKNLEEKVEDIKDSIVDRNQDKVPMLTASCRYRKSNQTSKDFMAVIATDSHGDSICVANSVNALNGFDKIDVLIHCGDCVADTFSICEDVSAIWQDIVANADKPFYFVLGNHEVGNYYGIGYAPTKTELYNSFIKPIVDSGYLNVNEYEVGRCYYYHDFASAKIRLIVLDEYEVPKILDDTYWESVEYNSSYDNIKVYNHTYSTGDLVKVPGYVEYAFKAKSNFTTSYHNKTIPSYKYRIGYRWISQTQAQWFLDTLALTPQNYQVIVACHNPYSSHADVLQSAKFSQNNNWIDGHGLQSYMVTDFIADAINAFQTKQNFSITCESLYSTDIPSYQVSKDFSQVEGKFHSLIGGHVHEDCVWKHQTYNQYQITPIDTNSNSYTQSVNADIRRSNSSDINSIDTDCLTVVSFGENRLGLVKLGVNVTDTGEKRDFEVIDIS